MTMYSILLIISIIVLAVVIYNVVKNKMNIHYSMIWIVWGFGTIIVALFPQIIVWLTNLLHIQVVSSTVFLIYIFLLYCLTFYVYFKISRHNEDIVNINYELASLKKKINDLEKKKK